MTLNYENETDAVLDLQQESAEALARRVIEAGLDLVDCPYEAQVSLLITNDEGIREMKRQTYFHFRCRNTLRPEISRRSMKKEAMSSIRIPVNCCLEIS